MEIEREVQRAEPTLACIERLYRESDQILAPLCRPFEIVGIARVATTNHKLSYVCSSEFRIDVLLLCLQVEESA